MARRKKKLGRPRTKIDLEEVYKLGLLHCTNEEMAAHLNVTIELIRRRMHDDNAFRTAYENGKGDGKLSLRRLLWLHAQKSAGAAIFLSKNLLGYQDNPLVSVTVNQAEVTDDVRQLKEQAADILRRDGWVVEMPASESVH